MWSGHVTCGPMRGLEKNFTGRGHTYTHTYTRTSRLYDWIGPVDQFSENSCIQETLNLSTCAESSIDTKNLHCAATSCNELNYTALHCTALRCITMHWTEHYCIWCTALNCTDNVSITITLNLQNWCIWTLSAQMLGFVYSFYDIGLLDSSVLIENNMHTLKQIRQFVSINILNKRYTYMNLEPWK